MIDLAQADQDKLHELDAEQLRELARALLTCNHEMVWRGAKLDKLTVDRAQLKRMKFDRTSAQPRAEQRAVIDEAVDGDSLPSAKNCHRGLRRNRSMKVRRRSPSAPRSRIGRHAER